MTSLQSVIDSFDAATRVFANDKNMFLRRVVVPSRTADAEISFRRDALSDNRLVLELALERCGDCPKIADDEPTTAFGPFFQSKTPCVQGDDNGDNGVDTVLSKMRCQHFLVQNSPRAFARALLAIRAYLGSDSDVQMYVESAQRQQDPVERYAIGERFAPNSLAATDLNALSNDVRGPKPWPYIYGSIAAVSLIVLVVVSILVYRAVRHKRATLALRESRAAKDEIYARPDRFQ